MTEHSSAADASDHDLALAARHDPAAFAALYHRHVQRVYRYALARLGNRQDAEDLTAHVFAAAFRSINRYRGDGPFAAWLMAIVRNQVVTRYRSRRPDIALDSPAARDALPVEGLDLDELAARQDQLRRVLQALQTLPPDHADVIHLRIVAGLSTAETADVMHRSAAAVRMLLHRALHDLRLRVGVNSTERETEHNTLYKTEPEKEPVDYDQSPR